MNSIWKLNIFYASSLHENTTTSNLSQATEYYHCFRAIDIVILVDGSKRMVPHWGIVKTFLKDLVGYFDINATTAKFSIVTYSTQARKELDFATRDKADIFAVIGKINILNVRLLTYFIFI